MGVCIVSEQAEDTILALLSLWLGRVTGWWGMEWCEAGEIYSGFIGAG